MGCFILTTFLCFSVFESNAKSPAVKSQNYSRISPMRTVFFGTPALAVPCLEFLAQQTELKGVVTTPLSSVCWARNSRQGTAKAGVPKKTVRMGLILE